MNSYEERKAERIDRLQGRAAKKRQEAASLRGQNQALAGVMNGTPVLRGHHSERRHRRDLERMHRRDQKAFELLSEAERLERRAAAAERSTAVSSDDPDAVGKLREKIAAEDRARDEMKRLNALHRKGGWDAVRAEVGDAKAAELRRYSMLVMEDRPYIAAAITNAGANIRRLKTRLAELEAAAAAPEREPERIGAGVIEEADNRVRIVFDAKPSEELRRALKGAGFRWAPSVGAWQRHASNQAWHAARRILGGA